MLCTFSYTDFHQMKAISENSFQHDFGIFKQTLWEIPPFKIEKILYPRFVPKASPGPGVINLSSIPLKTEQNQVLSKGMELSIAPSKTPYSEIIANTEGALHESRAEVGEIRAHFV